MKNQLLKVKSERDTAASRKNYLNLMDEDTGVTINRYNAPTESKAVLPSWLFTDVGSTPPATHFIVDYGNATRIHDAIKRTQKPQDIGLLFGTQLIPYPDTHGVREKKLQTFSPQFSIDADEDRHSAIFEDVNMDDDLSEKEQAALEETILEAKQMIGEINERLESIEKRGERFDQSIAALFNKIDLNLSTVENWTISKED